MRALRRVEGDVELVELDPGAVGPGEIRIAVAAAGICRTDLYVADGSLAAKTPVTLGHEIAGRIDAVGPGVSLEPGQLVAVDPTLPGPGVLGIDRDGGFAEALVVAASSAVVLPASMPARRAAYLEPVAAALAVAGAGLDPEGRGAVVGAGRIAVLTSRALIACGHRAPLRAGRAADLIEPDLDYVVETDGRDLDGLIAALRPGGTVVLKSRPAAPVPLDLRAAVNRRVTLRAVSYGSFSAAADLLVSERIEVDDLVGASFDLGDWQEAFAVARSDERRKPFFVF